MQEFQRRQQQLNEIFNQLVFDKPRNYCKIVAPQYIPDAKDYRIAAISDIKQNGPATIIFLKNGKKVVVKCQDGKCNDVFGLYICLIKYLVDNNKIYSQCVDYIFGNSKALISDFPVKKFDMMQGIILSHIDERDFSKIYDKFFSPKED